MAISIFEIFKIGIGPSSSHTVGPMRATKMFVDSLTTENLLGNVHAIKVELFGSLGSTGKGHGTDKAVILGLEGSSPESVEVDDIDQRIDSVHKNLTLKLNQKVSIGFNPKKELIFYRNKSLPFHPNGMTVHAYDINNSLLKQKTYYSVGGGFVLDDSSAENPIVEDATSIPYPFTTGKRLLEICAETKLSISQVMLENEKVWHSEDEIRTKILEIWQAMQECVNNGCTNQGILPGGLQVKRRASELYQKLLKEDSKMEMGCMEWVNLYALAVNEENAAGGRVVTAPTNGAAGIIPAVLHYYWNWTKNPTEDGIINFMLTATAIAILFKINASISGAEVGCQGEVGSACSMAAGALCEVLNGTPEQVENAAEIGMEHNLGLTCDPIGGLVQIPCIERNAMASVKAINAASMALRGDGKHFVSLDKVIITMRNTGADMKTKYKETSRGGLAVNIIEC